MKKVIILLLGLLFCTTGCGKKEAKDIIKDLTAKVNDTKSYTLKGNMEIYAEEETFTYSIEADYLKDNYYKVSMVNQTNNHEQIILRNQDAVYVITPSLNKSFKFQSEWPNNSSQAYLLGSILKDVNNDPESSTEEKDGMIIIRSVINYPNNPELKYQKLTIDNENNIKKNEIYDEKDKLKMKVVFTSIDYKASLKESDFKLENYIQESSDSQQEPLKENCKDTETCKEEEKCEKEPCTEETGAIENILYPLYIPSNTYLSKSDKVSTDVGERVILTFGGDKSFVLIEEKATYSDEFEIIPVYGDPLIVNDTIGALGTNSLSWTKDNINYYLAGNELSSKELLEIGQSIGYTHLSVSKEK